MEIDVKRLNFETEDKEILKSSTFFNPWSKNKNIWNNEFEDHRAIRIWNIFGQASLGSTDIESFKSLLEKEREIIEELSKNHEKFVVSLAFTPSWLSNSSDDSIMLGHITKANTHAPSDYTLWNKMISETVSFFNEFDVPMYYEVWNEPDIEYWNEGIDSYLKLYGETATTIKMTDPDAKVGGAVTSHWSNEMEPGRKSLNIELIEYAADNNLPLDFVSWHHYSVNPGKIMEAKTTFEKSFVENGYDPIPEYVVTEWNTFQSEIRKSPFASVIMAENLLGFYKAGVDIQAFSSWEDFHYYVDDFSGYGLITQQGDKKPQYYIHQIFDKMSRGDGLAVIENESLTMVIAKIKDNPNCYDMTMWNMVPHPEKEAIEYILQTIPSKELDKYQNKEKLTSQIWKGSSPSGVYNKEFSVANAIHNEWMMEELYKKNHDKLDLERNVSINLIDSQNVDIASNIAIKEGLNQKEVVVDNSQLLFNLENNEVFYVNLCLE